MRSKTFTHALSFSDASSTISSVSHFHPFRIHPMERVHASFLCHAEAPTRVAAGAQVLLHDFADADILDLNLVAEFHARFRRRAGMLFLRQVPFKDRHRALRSNRQHDVQRNIIWVAVQHPVRKNPEVVRGEPFSCVLIASRGGISGLRTSNRTELPHMLRIRLHCISVEVQFAIQPRMHARQVIAFEIIIHISFPVALHLICAALEELHACNRKSLDLPRQFAEACSQWLGIRIEIHEHKGEPLLGSHRHKREIFWPKSFDAFYLGGADQRPVKIISPAVVTAAEELARPASLGWRSSAVATYIVESAQHPIGTSHNQQWLAHYFSREIGARTRHLAAVPYHLPCAAENLFLFSSMYCRIGINARGQSPRPRNV